MNFPQINPDFLAWCERIGVDPGDCRRDSVSVVPSADGRWWMRYEDARGVPRDVFVDEKPPPFTVAPA